MKLSEALRALGRGIKLAFRIVKAKLRQPPAEPRPAPPEESRRLVEVTDFGENPGRLRMLAHLPPPVTKAPLVVLLHGCGQDAAQFAADSGWIALADRLRFALLLPEQAQANNAGRCFQWFVPNQTTRDKGEAGSIAAMTRAAIVRFDSDPRRVCIVGLSAGAAMAAAMLAAYPDLFAAGASVAGLPVGTAHSGMQAMLRMASPGPDRRPADWAPLVRAAAPAGFAGPWPRLSIWLGQQDTIVAPKNGHLLATQWCALHGISAPPVVGQEPDGAQHRTWSDGARQLVELWSLPNLPHAYPAGPDAPVTGRFVEPAPIDATAAIARFFGLEHDPATQRR